MGGITRIDGQFYNNCCYLIDKIKGKLLRLMMICYVELYQHTALQIATLSIKQPFYHLLAENENTFYVAYVSEQNLIEDPSGEPVEHPDVQDLFGPFKDGHYPLYFHLN